MKIQWIDETDSTNSLLMREADGLEAPLMVLARRQTAGRGQRGNAWESEPGKNLTFSLLFRPEAFPAVGQFAISEASALAVVDFLAAYGISANVKWPNDVYVGDRKICGILIQHSLAGCEIAHTVIGMGINVNQREFFSDAPNPVSMSQVSGREYDLGEAAGKMARCLERRLALIATEGSRRSLHEEFLDRLWRNDGAFHQFADRRSGERFEARIDGVDPAGPICLRLRSGALRTYEFKEVAFILNDR